MQLSENHHEEKDRQKIPESIAKEKGRKKVKIRYASRKR